MGKGLRPRADDSEHMFAPTRAKLGGQWLYDLRRANFLTDDFRAELRRPPGGMRMGGEVVTHRSRIPDVCVRNSCGFNASAYGKSGTVRAGLVHPGG